MARASRSRKRKLAWCRLVSWLLARNAVLETAATLIHVDASPEQVWNRIMLYEEVPGRPPLLLRTFLPYPVRTDGDKTCIGATVRCTYREGFLLKRIITVEPPHFLQFEVTDQCLGIEGCILTIGGSYQIHICGNAADVVLTTNYQARLRPRGLWRPLETLLVSQLHSHIIRGVQAALSRRNPAVRLGVAESFPLHCSRPGDLACSVSRSYFHR
jgi:hypothetical protein